MTQSRRPQVRDQGRSQAVFQPARSGRIVHAQDQTIWKQPKPIAGVQSVRSRATNRAGLNPRNLKAFCGTGIGLVCSGKGHSWASPHHSRPQCRLRAGDAPRSNGHGMVFASGRERTCRSLCPLVCPSFNAPRCARACSKQSTRSVITPVAPRCSAAAALQGSVDRTDDRRHSGAGTGKLSRPR